MNHSAKLSPRHFAPIFTQREAEVFALKKRGMRRKEIAVELGIETRTVDSYLARVRLKTAPNIFTRLTRLKLA